MRSGKQLRVRCLNNKHLINDQEKPANINAYPIPLLLYRSTIGCQPLLH